MIEIAETHLRNTRYFFGASAAPLALLISQVSLISGSSNTFAKILFSVTALAFVLAAVPYAMELSTRNVDDTELRIGIALGEITDQNALARYAEIKNKNDTMPPWLALASLTSMLGGYVLIGLLVFTLIWWP